MGSRMNWRTIIISAIIATIFTKPLLRWFDSRNR